MTPSAAGAQRREVAPLSVRGVVVARRGGVVPLSVRGAVMAQRDLAVAR